MIHPAKNPQPNGFDLATFAPSLDGVAGEALGTFLSDFQKGNNSMPKLPEVTVHVTTEPDPKEAHEFKASADLWAEQCRTLQRTLLDAQVECESLRVRLKHAQQGLGEGITRPHGGPEDCPTYHDGCNCTVEVLVHNIERAEKAETRVVELEAERDLLREEVTAWRERFYQMEYRRADDCIDRKFEHR